MKKIINRVIVYIAQVIFMAIMIAVITGMVAIVADQIMIFEDENLQFAVRLVIILVYIGGISATMLIKNKKGSVE